MSSLDARGPEAREMAARAPARRPAAARAKPRPATPIECRADVAAEATAKAMGEVASELRAMRKAVTAAADRLGPAADRVHDFAERLDRLCLWFKRWGPRLAWTLPVILTLMNGLSPEVAEAVRFLAERAVIALAAEGAGGG